MKQKILRFKKVIGMALLLVFLQLQCSAQLFNEWFRQKATQRKYLLEQIAALQVYIGYLKKGYNIAQKGLNTIGDIKKGDFNLHTDYFNSLKTVNPNIRKYPKVQDIIAIQQRISMEANNNLQLINRDTTFNSSERKYLRDVYKKLEKDCQDTIDDLTNVVTDGKLQMKDDERIERINSLYTQSQSQYKFCKGFGNSIKQLALQRKLEKQSLIEMKNWHGLQ